MASVKGLGPSWGGSDFQSGTLRWSFFIFGIDKSAFITILWEMGKKNKEDDPDCVSESSSLGLHNAVFYHNRDLL